MASPAFKRPADPLPHPAKRAATGPAGGDETADELRRALERQQKDYKAREAALLIRLSRKESEVQNLLSELQSLAPLLHPDSTNLTSKLLDPALQTLHVALRASLAEKDAKIAKLSEELAAREFTPQSVIGKRVVGRLKALQAENEELGKLVYGGRMEALEVELGLAKKVAMEAKNSLLDANALITDLDSDLSTLQPHLFNLRAELDFFRSRYGPKDSIVRDAEVQTEELEREQPEPEPEYYDDVEVDDGYFPVESGDREQGDVEGDGEEAGLEPVDLSLGDEGDVDVGEAGERELDRDVGIGIEAPLEPEPEGEPAYDGQEGELVEGGEMQ